MEKMKSMPEFPSNSQRAHQDAAEKQGRGEALLADVIKSIRETEGKAEEIRRNVQAESRRIILEAEQQAVKLVHQGVTEAEAKRREILAVAEQEAQQEVIPVQQRAAADVQKLQAGAQQKQEEAIKMVMERIVMTDERS